MIWRVLKALIVVLFIVLAIVYYYVPFDLPLSFEVLITVSTFLFAVLAGFFVSQQGKRYRLISDELTTFDGHMSAIYRDFTHLGTLVQLKSKKIIRNHYRILTKGEHWDHYITHKSSILTDLHELVVSVERSKKKGYGRQFAISSIIDSLAKAQISRKNLIALHQERIPRFQWLQIVVLAAIIIATLSLIPSQGLLAGSIIKSAFVVSVLSILLLMKEFDALNFYRGIIGKHSAEDVLDILEGRR